LDVQQNRLAEETQGDEGAAKLQEGQMNVGAVLVADLQAPEAVEPGEGAFNHPAVAAQSVLGLDAAIMTSNADTTAPIFSKTPLKSGPSGQARVPSGTIITTRFLWRVHFQRIDK
jgi:hypothetical protein